MATQKNESKIKRELEDTIYTASGVLEEKAVQTYDAMLDKLKYERDRLEREIKHEYRNARRYVRANPEQGLGIAFVAGLFLGALITKR
ncbi:glycine zipper domain-containing protein [Balneola sp. MJW-20]|uniref:glycine zipper domain-containing protein n=1 Tax=Gracilimonas aurantiaca TaxID=3234185 RepID=UPI003465B0D4